ncbi:MAG: helix-hairpin-helix domain-containing protein [Elusimicrobia bacterium]|nr:helix-hairpin-helix domain-containing protein [Elusimicrobiota bacterium]
MSITERKIFLFLFFFLCLGIGLKVYRSHLEEPKLKVLHNKEFEDLIKGFEDKREQAVELDLNLAAQKDFEALPGIGPSLAKEIIQYRFKNGKFIKPEELLKVKGMGPIRYEALRSYFKVNGRKGKPLEKFKKSGKHKKP